jgi:Fur family ferric uptake transcriptional regulator
MVGNRQKRKKRGIERMTSQRRAILEVLKGVDTHPSAPEIYLMVRRKLPRISLGTVYRNLEVMAGENMILKLDHAGSECRYDGNTADHSHVRCVRCGRIADAVVALPEEIKKAAAEATGYEVTGKRVEFIGLCPRCAGTRRLRKAGEGPVGERAGADGDERDKSGSEADGQ